MLLAALVMSLLSLASPSPSSPQDEEVRAVTLTAVDEKGEAVEGLSTQDVAVVENGVARNVTRFELDRRELILAIVVDTSEPVASAFRLNMVDAVVAFLQRLPQGTRAGVWTTGDRPVKVADYGTDPAAISRALRRVFPTGGNTLFDALVEASRDLRDRETSRAAIVVLTGKGIGFTSYNRQSVVEEVRKSPAIVLGVMVEEGQTGAGNPTEGDVSATDYDYVLSTLAESTGGRREVVLSPMGIPRALEGLAADLKGQYRLSYLTPRGLKQRKLDVKVARPGVQIRVGGTGR